MFRKIAMLCMIAVVAVMAGVLSQSNSAEAWPPDCPLIGRHYAHQWTSTEQAEEHYLEGEMGCYSSVYMNLDWSGVLGDITVPPTLPEELGTDDFIIGSVVMVPVRQGDPDVIGQIEAGIFTGHIGVPGNEIECEDEYCIFIEVQYPVGDEYEVHLEKFDPVVDLGSETRFEIWAPGPSEEDVAWNIMVTPPDWEEEFEVETDPLPPTGAAIVGLEIFDYSCWYSEDCEPKDVPRTTTFAYDWLTIWRWEWEEPPYSDPHWHLTPYPWYDDNLPEGTFTSSYDESTSDPEIVFARFTPDDYFNSFTTLSRPPCEERPWTPIEGDYDCDRYTDFDEDFIGTDATVDCGAFAWPSDLDDSLTVNILDLLLIKPHFNKCDPDPLYWRRADLDANGCVNILDLLPFKAQFNMSCTE